MKVEYLDKMGRDLDIVNDARVSFLTESKYERVQVGHRYEASYAPGDRQAVANYELRLSDRDRGLLEFLVRGMPKKEFEGIIQAMAETSDPQEIRRLSKMLDAPTHFTPFTKVYLKFRITCSIFVARQYFKHEVGFSPRNEVSRRYVITEPEFQKLEWRYKPDGNIKQGSGPPMIGEDRLYMEELQEESESAALNDYKEALSRGAAPEQARGLLPQTMLTTFIDSGSLAAYARLCKQRLDPHAQSEITDIAQEIDKHARHHFPEAWPILMGET